MLSSQVRYHKRRRQRVGLAKKRLCSGELSFLEWVRDSILDPLAKQFAIDVERVGEPTVTNNLNLLVSAQELSADDLATIAGMDRSFVSRILDGTEPGILTRPLLWLAFILTLFTKFDYTAVLDEGLGDKLKTDGIG